MCQFQVTFAHLFLLKVLRDTEASQSLVSADSSDNFYSWTNVLIQGVDCGMLISESKTNSVTGPVAVCVRSSLTFPSVQFLPGSDLT